jgi:alpha-beta hydrolase superfamily lysophospholipase
MGTAGANPLADIGLALIGAIKLFKGEKHISPLVNNIAFGSYNERFGGGTAEDPSPWLSSDDEVRKKYYADKYCTFKFTVSAMGDLIRLIKYSNEKQWYRNLPDSLPVLLVAGEEDPVGNYGKGVREVEEKLKKNGKNVECILYKGARHELLNDFTYEETSNDIIKFCSKQ